MNAALKPLGYCLLVFDGFRHNRGCAVDLSLWDIAANKEAAMAGDYDEMSPRSYVAYLGGTTEQKAHRDLLRSTMEHHGFTVLPAE